ncbi:MAG: sugar phosphate nucleotidyltransferase [Sneathiellaceae bacterium]
MPSANDNGSSGTSPLVPVLLAAGCGVDPGRPVARAANRKLSRDPDRDDIQHMVLRLLAGRDGFAAPIVVTGPGGGGPMADRLLAAGIADGAIVEMPAPVDGTGSHGTAAAVAAAARVAEARHGACLLLVLPCDILARELLALERPILQAARLAATDGIAASIGIRPWTVAGGFDHLVMGPARGAGSYALSALVAGADLQDAGRLQASGAGYWNSGTHVLPCGLLLSALARHAPALLGGVDRALAAASRAAAHRAGDRIQLDGAPLAGLPAVAIETAIAPCLTAGALVAASLGWGLQAGPRPGSPRAGQPGRPRGSAGADPDRGRPAAWRPEIRYTAYLDRRSA